MVFNRQLTGSQWLESFQKPCGGEENTGIKSVLFQTIHINASAEIKVKHASLLAPFDLFQSNRKREPERAGEKILRPTGYKEENRYGVEIHACMKWSIA